MKELGNEKKYEIDGQTFSQEPLTPFQLVKILDIFEKVQIEDFEKISTLQACKKIASVAGEFLSVILLAPDGEYLDESYIDFFQKATPFDVLMEVMTDFFTFNGIIQMFGMVSRLKTQSKEPSKISETKS